MPGSCMSHRATAKRCSRRRFQCFLAGRTGDDGETLLSQILRQRVADERFVIDDENRLLGGSVGAARHGIRS